MASTTPTLSVQTRTTRGKLVKGLRKKNQIPGVLYGFKIESTPIECAEKEFHKVYVQAGESTVVDLKFQEKTIPVLIHDIAFDPITGQYAHIDFLALDLMKEVTTHVPLVLTGEAPGVKEHGGVLVHNRDSLIVRCLPKDLPHAIEVDVSSLQNFHDTVTVAELKVPSGVKIEEKPEEIVASLIPPRKAEEAIPVTTAVEGVPAEGAAAAPGAIPAEGGDAATTPAAKGKEEKPGK
jgi:large subunit ribosomal protein L25